MNKTCVLELSTVQTLIRGGRQPAVLRTFSQRLCRGLNDAIYGFMDDDGWIVMSGDEMENVTIAINSSPSKLLQSHYTTSHLQPSRGVLCAKASMLL